MSVHKPNRTCDASANAAPYVLGALEDAESYRLHLTTCPACQAEVAELQPLVDMLPATVGQAVAPDGLRKRVLATVRSEAELFRAAGPEADRPPARGRLWKPRPLALLTAAGAMAATAVVAAAIAISTGSSMRERVTPAQIAASEPGARAALRQLGGSSELVVSGMRQPPLGKIYEVWLRRGTGSPQPTNALFSVTNRGSGSVAVPNDLHGVKEVLVTSEPLGGSLHPTSPPVIRVILRV